MEKNIEKITKNTIELPYPPPKTRKRKTQKQIENEVLERIMKEKEQEDTIIPKRKRKTKKDIEAELNELKNTIAETENKTDEIEIIEEQPIIEVKKTRKRTQHERSPAQLEAWKKAFEKRQENIKKIQEQKKIDLEAIMEDVLQKKQIATEQKRVNAEKQYREKQTLNLIKKLQKEKQKAEEELNNTVITENNEEHEIVKPVYKNPNWSKDWSEIF